MRSSLALLSTLFFVSGLAAQTIPNSAASLTIELTADGPADRFPKSFTVTFSNPTEHEVRLPKPTIACQGGLDGTLTIDYKFIPNEPRIDGVGHGCNCDYFNPPSVVERAKAWTPIAPGASVKIQVTTEQIYLEFPDSGKNIFTAKYEPPHFSKAEQELLRDAGISFPTESLVSGTVTAMKR